MAQQIQLRNGTAAEWTAANPVLARGETGVEVDTKKFKFGDGSTAWNSLAYAGTPGGGSGATTFAELTDRASVNLPTVNTPLQNALAAKQATLVSNTNIKTVGGVSLLGPGDVPVPGAAVSGVTYDGSNRVTGYTTGGVAHTVSYPNSTTITDAGGGVTRTVTLDGSGRVVSVATS